MSTTLTANLRVSAVASYASGQDAGSAKYDLPYQKLMAFVDGAGLGAAQKMWFDQRTIAASGSENLDLSGVLVDAFGNTLALTKVKALLFFAAAGNTNNVVVGGAASNAFATPFGDATDTVSVKPGGMLLLVAPDAAGYAVTAATGDILKVANSGGTTGVTYDVLILGV